METKTIELGRLVLCDLCNKDCTDLPDLGGFIFGSKGVCPYCAPRFLRSIVRCNEQQYIKATCPEGQSFADFIRAYRGPGATVTIGPLPVRIGPLPVPVCVECNKPFTDDNVKTDAGWREVAISTTCETCFDKMFGEE